MGRVVKEGKGPAGEILLDLFLKAAAGEGL